MREETSAILAEMAKQDHAFGALYRGAAKEFGLSEAAMWVLYAVESSPDAVSQRELSGSMGMSKQTVNSAVASLAANGFLELRVVPGTRNRKDIVLTEMGKQLASATVARLRDAEARAVESLGPEKARLYVDLHDEFISALSSELVKEGIGHGGR